jgi:hypothetical protein
MSAATSKRKYTQVVVQVRDEKGRFIGSDNSNGRIVPITNMSPHQAYLAGYEAAAKSARLTLLDTAAAPVAVLAV